MLRKTLAVSSKLRNESASYFSVFLMPRLDSGVMEAAVIEQTIDAAHKGQGHYAVGSRWHEGTLREMMKAIGSPSLAWRYGDG